ncbi:MAG: hypothetical protein ABSH33_11785 [Steroidobacteraceae bacterium]|jgi:hypothetical protein
MAYSTFHLPQRDGRAFLFSDLHDAHETGIGAAHGYHLATPPSTPRRFDCRICGGRGINQQCSPVFAQQGLPSTAQNQYDLWRANSMWIWDELPDAADGGVQSDAASLLEHVEIPVVRGTPGTA